MLLGACILSFGRSEEAVQRTLAVTNYGLSSFTVACGGGATEEVIPPTLRADARHCFEVEAILCSNGAA